ncbi:MAG: hypothetical protein U0237_05500 [Thermoleophilia bacterium]
MAVTAGITRRGGSAVELNGDLTRILAWSGVREGDLALLSGAAPDAAGELAGVTGPGCLVAVDPDPAAVAMLRVHLDGAGRHATVLDGDPGALPVLSGSVALAWVESARTPDPAAALAEAIRVTRRGGTVLVREPERAGEPPLLQAERMADCLAHAGLEDVRTLVALGLCDGAGPGDLTGQVAATLQDGLSAARVLRLTMTVAAAGRVPRN